MILNCVLGTIPGKRLYNVMIPRDMMMIFALTNKNGYRQRVYALTENT